MYHKRGGRILQEVPSVARANMGHLLLALISQFMSNLLICGCYAPTTVNVTQQRTPDTGHRHMYPAGPRRTHSAYD